MTCKCLIGDAVTAMSATSRQVSLETAIKGVNTDSRKLKPGELFVALQGENFDGHKFVEMAVSKGAIAAVVAKASLAEIPNAENLPLLIVTDTLVAYQNLAKWWRQQWAIPVIAVTGSAGKTTTKELISAMLSAYTKSGKSVHKSQANHNNDIGVAETLLNIDPNQHDFVIVEMGMRGLGEIQRLTEVAQPTIAVITNIGTAHIGRLGSQEAIATAKCELLQYMPTSGIAVLNAEDKLLNEIASRVWQGETLTYGIGIGDIQGELSGEHLKVDDFTWQLPLSGRHNALNFLAGLGVLRALNLEWETIKQGIGQLDLPAGRAQVHHLDRDVVILDETYNASPEATIAALHLLANQSAHKRWAILGTMKELGDMSKELHTKVGKTAQQLGIDYLLILADEESEAILLGAGQDFKTSKSCKTFEEINQTLLELVQSGDRLLFKASRSVGMDRAVKDFQQAWQSK